MTALALYCIFLSALCAYRASKYWPNGIKLPAFMGNPFMAGAFAVIAIVLLITKHGSTTAILLSLTLYMAAAGCVVFFANTNRFIRYGACALLHIYMVLALIFNI